MKNIKIILLTILSVTLFSNFQCEEIETNMIPSHQFFMSNIIKILKLNIVCTMYIIEKKWKSNDFTQQFYKI